MAKSIALVLTLLLLPCVAANSAAAQKSTAPQLIELVKSPGPSFREAITATFDAKDLQQGTAWIGHGSDFFFVTHAPSIPLLMIDDLAGPAMRPLEGTDLW